jgi:hypothetical protein
MRILTSWILAKPAAVNAGKGENGERRGRELESLNGCNRKGYGGEDRNLDTEMSNNYSKFLQNLHHNKHKNDHKGHRIG